MILAAPAAAPVPPAKRPSITATSVSTPSVKNTAKEQGWKKTKDPSSGKFYYGNPKTGETSWTPPPGWVDEDDGAEALIAQREAAAKKAEAEAKRVEAEKARKAEADRVAAEEAAAAERKRLALEEVGSFYLFLFLPTF